MNGNKRINGKGTSPKLLLNHKITDEYILHSAVNSLSNSKLAIALSNNEILYFDSIHKVKTSSLKCHERTITGIKFSKENPNVLYSSSLDGTICVWDIRSGVHPVETFSDDTDGPLKPLLCFDLNANGNLMCAGTELIREDAFLIFWDIRKSQNLGGYWDSHTDDITHVQFHATRNSMLASSSVDGLINFYDLTESSEEDALQNTLNCETSVNKFFWNDDAVSCITGTEESQFWSSELTSPSLTVTRQDLENGHKYLIDYHVDTFCVENSFYLASGSNDGCIQLYTKRENGFKLVTLLEDGHADVIRTVSYCEIGKLFSGGEDGHLCVWKLSL